MKEEKIISEPLIKVENLYVSFDTEQGEVESVCNVSFHINRGETVGIVGESGCGKTVTSLAILKLLGRKGRISKGSIWFKETDIAQLTEKQMRKIRGNEISMIFQEPMTSLNPVYTIGNQLVEGIRLHRKLSKKEAREYAIEMLDKVGIPRPKEIIDEYPQALSGGMRQRVMIAMALACEPSLLIADEPTTALDATIQAQILELLKDLRQEYHTSIMLITHDLGVVAEMADRVIVMYAGQIIEDSDVFTLFEQPEHPYTQGLLKSIPLVEGNRPDRLVSIPGTVPSLFNMPQGCRFHTRCPHAFQRCYEEEPPLFQIHKNHKARCWLVENRGVKEGAEAHVRNSD